MNGASRQNLTNMKHHIAQLEKCANAYFHDIQREMRKRDYEFQLRWVDWKYAKCALERITEDFSDRLDARAQRTETIAANHPWVTLEHNYSKHESDWQRTAKRTMVRPRNYVQFVQQDEALWYQPSSNFETPAKLMTERPKQISPAPSKMPGAKDNGPANNSPKNNAPEGKSTKTTGSNAIVTPVQQTKPSGYVAPHLRGSQKKTPTTAKQLITPESNYKAAVKAKPTAWVPPHLRVAHTKETRVSVAAVEPEKAKEEKLPPHLRGSLTKGPKVTHQKTQAPVTPPATVASPETVSTTNSPVSNSEDSSASNMLIDVSDLPATVFDSSAKKKATHGTTDVWSALLQLTNGGSMAGTSAVRKEICDLLW